MCNTNDYNDVAMTLTVTHEIAKGDVITYHGHQFGVSMKDFAVRDTINLSIDGNIDESRFPPYTKPIPGSVQEYLEQSKDIHNIKDNYRG